METPYRIVVGRSSVSDNWIVTVNGRTAAAFKTAGGADNNAITRAMMIATRHPESDGSVLVRTKKFGAWKVTVEAANYPKDFANPGDDLAFS